MQSRVSRLWGLLLGNQTKITNYPMILMAIGGSGGIRTHGRVPPTLVFKTRALNHSATLPYRLAAGAFESSTGGICTLYSLPRTCRQPYQKPVVLRPTHHPGPTCKRSGMLLSATFSSFRRPVSRHQPCPPQSDQGQHDGMTLPICAPEPDFRQHVICPDFQTTCHLSRCRACRSICQNHVPPFGSSKARHDDTPLEGST